MLLLQVRAVGHECSLACFQVSLPACQPALTRARTGGPPSSCLREFAPHCNSRSVFPTAWRPQLLTQHPRRSGRMTAACLWTAMASCPSTSLMHMRSWLSLG